MTIKNRLTKNITENEFDNGYWYADEIKAFAKQLGIANSSKLRKDELEQLIKVFIRTGKVERSNRKNIVKTGKKDLDIGLSTCLPIINYTSNEQTKNFITTESQKIAPKLTIKSGAWYRLNRWRDERITNGVKITYGDLVNQFVKLNQTDKFEKVVVGRYINFLSDFLANEKGATRQQAVNEWEKLKTLNIEKDYKSWKRHKI
ncbi:MAG TPA: hypothetical protein DHV29_04205 [Bacteroidales bacterium]|nr:hypothetical protein [Bacteroidales bacterium]HCB63111.1 hypothetical protein [Bacteroidales bacterium]HCY22670.1 hypothetical protein [Bacteroidales bacterium]